MLKKSNLLLIILLSNLVTINHNLKSESNSLALFFIGTFLNITIESIDALVCKRFEKNKIKKLEGKELYDELTNYFLKEKDGLQGINFLQNNKDNDLNLKLCREIVVNRISGLQYKILTRLSRECLVVSIIGYLGSISFHNEKIYQKLKI